MAGYTSRVWLPILDDFIGVAQKLDNLGFVYYKGKVLIVDAVEEQKHA